MQRRRGAARPTAACSDALLGAPRPRQRTPLCDWAAAWCAIPPPRSVSLCLWVPLTQPLTVLVTLFPVPRSSTCPEPILSSHQLLPPPCAKALSMRGIDKERLRSRQSCGGGRGARGACVAALDVGRHSARHPLRWWQPSGVEWVGTLAAAAAAAVAAAVAGRPARCIDGTGTHNSRATMFKLYNIPGTGTRGKVPRLVGHERM